MSVESVCASYVRGEIEVDELERQVERALTTAQAPTFEPPRWMVEDFARSYAAARASAPTMVLAGGMASVPIPLWPSVMQTERQ